MDKLVMSSHMADLLSIVTEHCGVHLVVKKGIATFIDGKQRLSFPADVSDGYYVIEDRFLKATEKPVVLEMEQPDLGKMQAEFCMGLDALKAMSDAFSWSTVRGRGVSDWSNTVLFNIIKDKLIISGTDTCGLFSKAFRMDGDSRGFSKIKNNSFSVFCDKKSDDAGVIFADVIKFVVASSPLSLRFSVYDKGIEIRVVFVGGEFSYACQTKPDSWWTSDFLKKEKTAFCFKLSNISSIFSAIEKNREKYKNQAVMVGMSFKGNKADFVLYYPGCEDVVPIANTVVYKKGQAKAQIVLADINQMSVVMAYSNDDSSEGIVFLSAQYLQRTLEAFGDNLLVCLVDNVMFVFQNAYKGF